MFNYKRVHNLKHLLLLCAHSHSTVTVSSHVYQVDYTNEFCCSEQSHYNEMVCCSIFFVATQECCDDTLHWHVLCVCRLVRRSIHRSSIIMFTAAVAAAIDTL
jgi:hypothetical protein